MFRKSRFIFIILLISMLTLTGCGGYKTETSSNPQTKKAEEYAKQAPEEKNILLDYIVGHELSEKNNKIFTPDRYEINIMEVNGHNVTEKALDLFVHDGAVKDENEPGFFNNEWVLDNLIAINNKDFPDVVIVYVDWRDREDDVILVGTYTPEGKVDYWETSNLTMEKINPNQSVSLIKNLK
ncbi:hypothetical protein BHU72_14710 [Desulfuribacillus stibiiarsenatis]|uniref:Lipoprotein n=1 Tax=Desulfuribacillus stibiiarsenatis TaxID=1390249 RepID=A0A1E5L794_9FIRM|nr:hypothetical protein [Desulfuribacillus stibiiarsenatis]OEH86001.1 hypothetical protein BHU72_14710 [Desulfuribacillus stibiiarsenatis]